MRVYDATPSESSQAFLEIKKKNKIGYKYRLTSNPVSVTNYIENGVIDSTIKDDKVTSELEMLRERYGTIKPKMYIYYDRVSYKGIEDKKFVSQSIRTYCIETTMWMQWKVNLVRTY